MSPPYDMDVSHRLDIDNGAGPTVKSSMKIPSSVLFGEALGSYLKHDQIGSAINVSPLNGTRGHSLSA
jgi:hypothetical protein